MRGISWLAANQLASMILYDQECALVFKYSNRYSCQILIKFRFLRQVFKKYSNIKFHENPSSGSRVVPCGWTDKTKLVAFRNFARAPLNCTAMGPTVKEKWCDEFSWKSELAEDSKLGAQIHIVFGHAKFFYDGRSWSHVRMCTNYCLCEEL